MIKIDPLNDERNSLLFLEILSAIKIIKGIEYKNNSTKVVASVFLFLQFSLFIIFLYISKHLSSHK